MLIIAPVSAKDGIKMRVNINHDFSVEEIPSEVYFKTQKLLKVSEDFKIPQRSIVTAETLQAQKERRWHKSGYILAKLKSYQPELTETPIDISDKNIYIVARKYEKIDKKEASIVATEILLSQAASFFAPGVDILYFFTKGAIQRKKNPNWFKAGVSNAYENSICWFWLKGKPINLEENAELTLKEIDEEKALKLKNQIEVRKEKQAIKDKKKQIRLARKEEKRLLRQERKILKSEQNEYYIRNIDTIKNIEEAEKTQLEIIDEAITHND